MRQLFLRFLHPRFRRHLLSAALPILSLSLLQAQDWQPLPMVGKATLEAGIHPGGDGAQWPRDIAINQADPNFMLMVTDVGGIYRSLDGGRFWQVSMDGYYSRGGWAIAMDPKNPKRALIAAMNVYSWGVKANGLYLTTDKGASWTQVSPSDNPSSFGSVAYDESSFNPALGYCTIAYWLSPDGGILKSTDGGVHWSQINANYSNSNTRIKVHPGNGHVYLASSDWTDYGLYRSTDGGVTFTQVDNEYVFGIDIVDTVPDNVYISRWAWTAIYNDATGQLTTLGSAGLPGPTQPFQNIAVSRANPKNMTTWADLGNFNWVRYYSNDGGNTWGVSDMGNNVDGNFRLVTNELLPYNVRQGVWAWHPVDPNVVFSFGGDWITKSSDAGARFTWSGNGYNAVFTMPFNFSPFHPNDFLLATKDYNSYLTQDGGRSWNYEQTGFDFGGYAFGGFSLDREVAWVGDDPLIDAQGDPLLKITRDGGKTWNLAKDSSGNNITVALNANKFDLVSAGDPRDPRTGFIGAWRTTDRGASWSQMTGVDMVLTYDPLTGALYGRSGNSIVKSTDHGITWQTVATYTTPFRDLAYDPANQRFWLVANDQLVQYANQTFTTVTNLPTDEYNSVRVASVAVDPYYPNIVYVVNHRDIWLSTNSVVRSTDGGATWENLTENFPLPFAHHFSGGPHEGYWVRVNPATRAAWVGTNCFGLWKIAPPF